jgi:broad specificity phosphatase PhoE
VTVPQRLAVIGHGPTRGLEAATFGGVDGLLRPDRMPLLRGRVAHWVSAPEPACVETASGLGGGGAAEVLPGLRGCDFGSWSGLTLAEVGTAEPAAVSAWLSDPTASPHGGESLRQLIVRTGAAVDDQSWPDGLSVAVVTPLVARAIAVHALGAPAETIFRVDVGPLGRLIISRTVAGWRLQALDRRLTAARPPRLRSR